MSLNFAYSFPAVVGQQAGRDFFVIMCPLKVLPKLFIFNEEELPPELKTNRTINKSRIPEICDYILSNRHDYVFSSLTASIDGEYEFIPMAKEGFNSIGMLKISMDSKLLINDGQHRKSALEEAIRADQSLGNETISVVLFIDEGLKRSQQIFSDLNRHAVNVSKSISITYDHRDPIAQLTKELIYDKNELHQFTDLENSTLAKYSNKIFTISNFYKANKRIINNLPYQDPKQQKEIHKFIRSYWYYLIDNIPEWQFSFNKQMSAYTLREEYIISYGTVLEALGILGNHIYQQKLNYQDVFAKLNNINWSRNNLSDWKNRVIGNDGRILRNSKSINLTSNKIKMLLELSLSPQELNNEGQFMEE